MASAGAQNTTPLPSMALAADPAPPALQIKLLSSTAKAPTRGSAYAAGYDLYASKATTIPARGKVLVDTDISIAVPAGTYGRVAPRSGLASKHSIDVGAGVIDADYRGPVKVLLFNFSEVEFKVEVGERVAQLIVERVSSVFSWFGRIGVLTLLFARSTPRRSLLSKSLRRLCVALVDSARRVGLAARCLALTLLLFHRVSKRDETSFCEQHGNPAIGYEHESQALKRITAKHGISKGEERSRRKNAQTHESTSKT
jgi:deoxyuridine 5'-triphosphate nucleotidohydrolase